MEKKQTKSQILLAAIRTKCVEDCCAGDKSEVRNCLCPSCPLYEYRMGVFTIHSNETMKQRCANMRTAKANKNAEHTEANR